MRNESIAVALALICTVLCGCSTYRQYSRPDLPGIPDEYLIATEDSSSVAVPGWKDFFTDSLLQRIIETGLANNADVQIAGQRIKEAEASLDIARKAFLPGLNFSPSGTLSHSDARYGGTVSSHALPFTASWEVDFGGKLVASSRKAQAGLDAAALREKSIRTELISSIAECYYGLLKLDAQLLVSETTSLSWQENVRTMKALKNAGLANEASVAQTEANSCSIEASLYDLRYDIVQLENALSVLIGVKAQKFERCKLADVTLPLSMMEGVPAFLLSGRPDVQAAEAELRQAFYDTKAAEAAFYPSLTLNGEAGWEKALSSPSGWLLSLGAGLLQPVFAKGRIKGNLKIAEARQEEALAAFRQSLLSAGGEVNDALALCQSASSKTNVRKRQIESLESAVESTGQLMRHGGATYLEVLTAQQSLLSARLLQISDRYDSIIGTVHLYKALGGGTY